MSPREKLDSVINALRKHMNTVKPAGIRNDNHISSCGCHMVCFHKYGVTLLGKGTCYKAEQLK